MTPLSDLPADFRAIFEATPSPYLVLATDFTIVAVNDAYLTATGTTRAMLLGRHLFEAFPDNPNDPHATGVARLRASLERVLARKKPDTMDVQKYDIELRDRPGEFEERYWSPVNTPVFGSGGEIACIIHRVEDVTSLTQSQARMRQMASEISAQAIEIQTGQERTRTLSNEREYLHSLLMAVPVAVWVLLGPEHRYFLRNDAHAALFPRANAIGKTFEETEPDKRGGPVLGILSQVYRTGLPYRLPGQHVTMPASPAGEPRELCYDFAWHPLFGAGGRVDGVLATGVDVTEQYKARRAIEESEARLHLIANALPQIVWTARPDGYIDWYNDWWYRYSGMERDARWRDTGGPLHPDDLQETTRRWKHARETGLPYEVEHRLRRKADDQYRWHLARAHPIRDEHGHILKWIGSDTDIEEQKQVEWRLGESQRLRERFTNALAHDLRSPLSTALMAAQFVHRFKPEDAQRDHLLQTIVSALRRVDEMVENLLDASLLEAGQSLPLAASSCDLHAIVERTIGDLALVHGKRVIVRGAGETRGWWSGDGLRRVLENLVTNAFKYGAPDTPITVVLEHGADGPRLGVHNYGRALSEVEKQKLFQLFQRTETARVSGQQGWGIGLAVVKGIVESHGGTVAVDSEPAAGTTFTVALPWDSRPFLA
jgi:PAS domain S-box-containing protein